MIIKVLIFYIILLYSLHRFELFEIVQRFLYSEFYVSNRVNMRALIYEPYDFSDVHNIIMASCATPYGLTLLLMTFMTILFGYITIKWYALFTVMSYILLIISHYAIYQGSEWVPMVVRMLVYVVPVLNMVFFSPPSDRTQNINKYKSGLGTNIPVLFIMVILDRIITYNYKPDLGKYTIANPTDYKRIYTPKWVFTSFLIPIYIMTHIGLTNMGVNNAVVKAIAIGFIFIVVSYGMY